MTRLIAGMASLTHKRGDTFDKTLVISNDIADGYFADWTATCQVRKDTGALVETLTATWVNPATTRSLKVFAIETDSWPVGTLYMDVQFTRNSDQYKRSTETIQIDVVIDITIP